MRWVLCVRRVFKFHPELADDSFIGFFNSR